MVRTQLRLENRSLQARYDQMQAERDDLQLEIWELEDLIEELFGLLTATSASSSDAELAPIEEPPQTQALPAVIPAKLPTVDLSTTKLALVGGHHTTRRGVIQALSQYHGLTQWVELPPFSKHGFGRSTIKAKIWDCDLIVLITGYMKHQQTDSIMQLRKGGSLSGEVLLLSRRGKSGVVREILAHVSQKNC
ncbi:hypothetical protein [Sphaerothrix gracilis]|uniref:hypothetical protein n=1 Tax=Sphaerothrix gracilis TaxID=3151835 RepID=UPI0031FBB524